MAFETTQVDNQPIWVSTFTEPYDSIADSRGVEQIMGEVAARVDGDIYYIADLRNIHVNFSDIVTGLAEAFKPGSGSFYNRPNVHLLTVATDDLIKMATEATKQAQYGGIEVKLFATTEEAIEHVRAIMA